MTSTLRKVHDGVTIFLFSKLPRDAVQPGGAHGFVRTVSLSGDLNLIEWIYERVDADGDKSIELEISLERVQVAV